MHYTRLYPWVNKQVCSEDKFIVRNFPPRCKGKKKTRAAFLIHTVSFINKWKLYLKNLCPCCTYIFRRLLYIIITSFYWEYRQNKPINKFRTVTQFQATSNNDWSLANFLLSIYGRICEGVLSSSYASSSPWAPKQVSFSYTWHWADCSNTSLLWVTVHKVSD